MRFIAADTGTDGSRDIGKVRVKRVVDKMSLDLICQRHDAFFILVE